MRSSDIELLRQTAEFLVRFGYLGTGLLLLLIAYIIYKSWKSIYFASVPFSIGLVFLVFFGAFDALQKVAPHWFPSKRAFVAGAVLGIGDGYNVQLKSDRRHAGQAYIKREHDRELPNVYNFPFILLSAEAPSCLALAVTSTDANSEAGSNVFNIAPISENDVSADVELLFEVIQAGNATKLQFWREQRQQRLGEPVLIDPLTVSAAACGGQHWRTSSQPSLVGRAHAQARPGTSVGDFASRLRSDDLFTRRDARIDLSRQGAEALDIISQLLDSGNYRIQLGALIALSEMPDNQRKRASPALVDKARVLLNHNDAAMREAAARAIR